MGNIILIADDEPWQRMWIARILHNAGFTCSTVGDGGAVVERAIALDPDLVILDIEMPGVNGLMAAEQLRMLPNTRNVPILFVTGYPSRPEVHAGEQPQRTEWLLKPFHPDELLHRVQRMLANAGR